MSSQPGPDGFSRSGPGGGSGAPSGGGSGAPPGGGSGALPGGFSRGSERRLALLVLAGCCVVLAGWIVVLAVTLPHRFDVHHWRGVWVGFDIFLLAVLIATAWAAWRERQVLILLLMILGTMLCCDAWFDVGTAERRHGGFGLSLATAVIAELPLAFIAFAGARRLLRATVRAALGHQPGGASGGASRVVSAGEPRHLLRATPLSGNGLQGVLPHRRHPRPGLDQLPASGSEPVAPAAGFRRALSPVRLLCHPYWRVAVAFVAIPAT
jgi:hypothetical protein